MSHRPNSRIVRPVVEAYLSQDLVIAQCLSPQVHIGIVVNSAARNLGVARIALRLLSATTCELARRRHAGCVRREDVSNSGSEFWGQTFKW